MEGLASRRWALPSGYRRGGFGGEPLNPEPRWNYGPGYLVESAGGDVFATSESEPLGF